MERLYPKVRGTMITTGDIGRIVLCDNPSTARFRGKLRAITGGDWAMVKVTEIDIGYGWEEVNELRIFPIGWCEVEKEIDEREGTN